VKRIVTARYVAVMHKSADVFVGPLELPTGQQVEVEVQYSIGGGMREEVNPLGETFPEIISVKETGAGRDLSSLLEDDALKQQLIQQIDLDRKAKESRW
tara:strand:+ start:415 stop:711 length:297 start_codon:yes stop_codon:yes gene_type:complete